MTEDKLNEEIERMLNAKAELKDAEERDTKLKWEIQLI